MFLWSTHILSFDISVNLTQLVRPGLSANGEMDAAAATEDKRISSRAVGPARPGSRKRPRPAQSEKHDSSSADDRSSSDAR